MDFIVTYIEPVLRECPLQPCPMALPHGHMLTTEDGREVEIRAHLSATA